MLNEHLIQGKPNKRKWMKCLSYSHVPFSGDQLFQFSLDWGDSQERGLSALNQESPSKLILSFTDVNMITSELCKFQNIGTYSRIHFAFYFHKLWRPDMIWS